jgi:hypothetical protein
LNQIRCIQLADSNGADGINRGGYTYSHYSPLPIKGVVSKVVAQHNAKVIKEMNARGFVVNLSADNLAHADQLADLAIGPIVTILPRDANRTMRTPNGRRVIVCPAVLHHNVNCVDCKVCANATRKSIIGFPAHGSSAKRVDAIARE